MVAAIAVSATGITLANSSVPLPLLDHVSGMRYAVSTRDAARPVGGDMSFSTGGDDPEGVVANRATWLAAIGAIPDTTVMSGLVHGTTVVAVGAADAGRGVRDPATTIAATDALITDVAGLTLGMCFADCTPLLLVDPVRRAIGLGHAGWRGTLAGMPGAMVRAMYDAYGSDPADLLAVIGPTIGPEMYEVGADVAEPFAAAFPDAAVLRPVVNAPDESRKPGKWLLDLWTANAVQFTRAGLSSVHIAVSGICTLTHGDRFFSHRYARAYNEREGRFAVFIRLTDGEAPNDDRENGAPPAR